MGMYLLVASMDGCMQIGITMLHCIAERRWNDFVLARCFSNQILLSIGRSRSSESLLQHVSQTVSWFSWFLLRTLEGSYSRVTGHLLITQVYQKIAGNGPENRSTWGRRQLYSGT